MKYSRNALFLTCQNYAIRVHSKLSQQNSFVSTQTTARLWSRSAGRNQERPFEMHPVIRLACTFILFLLVVTGILPAQDATSRFTTYRMGGANSAEFTTENFKCIGVGKGNRIWAGTQYGGLYIYDDDGLNIWRKSTKLTNVFINDIKADADSGIWIAQSGTTSIGGNSNIAGGVNLFRAASDLSMEFYSVAGTTTSADLQSRNAKGLYIDKSYSAARGRLPRPWVAQGSYISAFNAKRGGINIGVNPTAPFFNNVPGHFSSNSNATSICEAIGGNSSEIWVAVRQNGPVPQILRYKPNGDTISNPFTSTNTPLLPNGFIAQAIHVDVAGNRWIGLKAGGLVIKTPTEWVKMDNPSRIPTGTAVNYNAIASDEYKNVYIGTSSGLLEYQSPIYYPASSPDNVNSYKLYTEADGLANNNVTGLAYDKKNGRLLIATSGGVTFMNKREPYIKGVVFDVFCNLDKENPYSGLQRKGLSSGVTITLLRDGVEEEVAHPDANGIFELKEAEELLVYSVEVKYINQEGRAIRYIYNNIKNHTLMEPSLMPDSLIRELKAFKSKLQRRCFPVKLYFQIEADLNIFCTDGFNTGTYEAAANMFYVAEGITVDHKKRVDNLAAYYTALATVYNLGGNATDLAADAVSNLFDAIESLKGFVEFGISLKKPGNANTLAKINEQVEKGLIMAIRALKEAVNLSLTASSSFFDQDHQEGKKIFDRCVSSLNEVADLAIEAFDKGRNPTLVKALIDNLKKILAQKVAIYYYREDYARDQHKYFVGEVSLSAYANESNFPYEETFDNLYNPISNSLVKYGKDTLDHRKASITQLNNLSKAADMASNVLDAAAALALVPGGQLAGAIAKGLSLFAKATKTSALTGAMYLAAVGVSEESNLSDKIKEKSGLQRESPGVFKRSNALAQSAPDSLVARKNRYNQRLAELQTIYTTAYDSAAYVNKRKQFVLEDSLYTAAMQSTLNALWASTDTAVAVIPGFKARLTRVIDSFVSLQYTLRQSLYFQNLAYIFEPDKSVYAPGLDSIGNEIRLANDSAVNGIASLITSINNNGVGAPAYLVQEGYQINHTRVPGTAGTVTYTFRNYGAEAQNNVSFKISQPSGGYIITGADSVNVGVIQSGEAKTVTYAFQSPMTDSIGDYTIEVKATNGRYKNAYGAFYAVDPNKFHSIKNGNWDDPSTWSSNAVPAATNSVYIIHEVTVNVDASCKNLTIDKPGNVIVNTGKKINIFK